MMSHDEDYMPSEQSLLKYAQTVGPIDTDDLSPIEVILYVIESP